MRMQVVFEHKKGKSIYWLKNLVVLMKISDIGETELIKRIHKKVGQSSKDVIKGIGDDAAVVVFDKKYYMLFTTDSLFENVHFSLKFFHSALSINKFHLAGVKGMAG